MPKSKEFVSDSDGSSEEERPKKKQKKAKNVEKEKPVSNKKAEMKNKEDDEDGTWDLGNNRQVKVKEFKGKLYVDIREMYYDNSAELKPGKKGISLTMPQWRKFMSIIEDVDELAKSKC